MTEEFINILLIVLIIIACAYFYFNSIKIVNTSLIQEAMTGDVTTNNEREGASKYVDTLKSTIDKMKSGLNVATYRTDYEHVLIQLDDLVGYSMLKVLLDIDVNVNDQTSIISAFDNLNKLSNSKQTLDKMMTWMDKQK